jgi:hypothetical protein
MLQALPPLDRWLGRVRKRRKQYYCSSTRLVFYVIDAVHVAAAPARQVGSVCPVQASRVVAGRETRHVGSRAMNPGVEKRMRLVSLDRRTSLPASRDTGARASVGVLPLPRRHRAQRWTQDGAPRNVFRARQAAAERPTSPPATIDTDDTNTVRLHLPGQTMLGLCFCCYSYSPTLPRFGGTPDTVQLSLIGTVA